MAERQFVGCAFRREDTRLYTYHWDGERPLVPGDGWRRVYVREVHFTRPAFETKPVLGIAEPEEEPPAKVKAEPTPPVTRDLFG